jgi:hypothetical protein
MLMVAAGLAMSAWTSAAMAQVKSNPTSDKPTGQPSIAPVAPVKPMPAPAAPAAPVDPNQPHPQISFDKTSNDFGVISDDNSVNTEFKFSNSGAATLIISNVQGSCGCTVPALEKKEYAPGESGAIKVTYNPHGRRGKQQTNVTVTSNDPLKPTQILELHSEIKPLMMLEPMVANFQQAQKGKPTTTTVMITSRGKDLAPTQATSSSNSLSVKLLETKEATVEGETVKQTPMEISTLPNAEVGQVSGQITVRTTDPARILNMSVMGEIVGDVNVQPQRVQLSALEPGASMNTQVKLTSRNNKAFKVEKVEEAPSGAKLFQIAVSEDTTATPSAWTITVTGNAPQSGAFRGDLVVTTNIEDEKTVKIPYYGFVRNAPPQNPGFIGDAWTANPSLLQR